MGITKGFNYSTGRWVLDCDKCGRLQASRIKCPIRYCSPVQLCANCAKETGFRKKEKHAKCYEGHAKLEKEREEFLSVNANKWVVVSVWGSWADWVPNNMVGVCAYRGGNAGGRTGEPAYFLVPEEEYRWRPDNGFIIDEERHLRFENDPTLLVTKEVASV